MYVRKWGPYLLPGGDKDGEWDKKRETIGRWREKTSREEGRQREVRRKQM